MSASARRRRTVDRVKRELILEAAQRVFEAKGLEGASLRAIAAEAGYTPAALYFHFESKEAIYAALLARSLARLRAGVEAAAGAEADAAARFRAAGSAFFRFYLENPRDLDLGFYLFQGGLKPKGLGWERDRSLNAALAACLAPIGAAAREMGLPENAVGGLLASVFAHLVGILLLEHTGRIRMFGAEAGTLADDYLADLAAGRGLP